MNKPVISVIVPVYKVEQYIHKCIDSILAQTFTDFELILIDDGSPDNCPIICDKYAKKDSRIKVIHKINGGLSDARNVALDIVKGEYISFVDGDDYIANNMLQRMLDELKKTQSDICVCDNWRIEKNELLEEKHSLPQQIYLHEDAMKLILSDEIGSQAWRYMYKCSLWDGIRFPKGRRYEDIATTYLVIDRANKMVHICDKLYYYLIRDSSISYTQCEINAIHIYHGFKERYEFGKKYYPQFNDITLGLVIKFAINLYNSNLIGGNKLIDSELLKEIYQLMMNEYKNIIKSKKIAHVNKGKITLLKVNKTLYSFLYKAIKK